ncbi:MAG TPA: hypothetical protein DCL41_01325, partial [Bdellovibrionales bacterium]|nr:hypothetical protein [Bdellovibrionales bacterium]
MRIVLSILLLTGSLSAFGQAAPGATEVAPGSGGNPQLQQELQADLDQCGNQKKQAELCCGDPMQCASGMSEESQQQLSQLMAMGAMGAAAYLSQKKSDGEGGDDNSAMAASLPMICQMMSAMGSAGAGANAGAAEVCDKERSTCDSMCGEIAQKWKQKQTECQASSCADGELLSQAVTQFDSTISECKNLQANSESMNKQGKESQQAGGAGDFCNQLASMMTASKKEPTQPQIDCNDPVQFQANLQMCVDCQKNPEDINCGKVAAVKGPKAGFDEGKVTDLSSFNTGSIDGLDQNAKYGGFEPVASQSGTVSGSGGGIPGGGNDGNFGDPAPANAGERSGINTDILSGERGGGGYSAASAGMDVDPSAGFSGYGGGSGSNDDVSGYKGMDLKKFLPGGALDPSRRLAGALVSSGQINPKN